MARSKKERRKVGNHTKEVMQRAVDLVKQGRSIHKAADECKLKYSTLRRYVKKLELNPDANFIPNTNSVFSADQENALKDYITECAQMFYGLSSKECRQLAYQMANATNLKVPPSWINNHIAGKDWLRSFKKRHSTLRLRKPETSSLARAAAFNKVNVQAFFRNLREAMQRDIAFSDGTRIYNLYEILITTVQGPQKILARKGSNVCKYTSADRGELVTTCLMISASGQALPPAMVFPRNNFDTHMLHGAPSATLGLATTTGWMNAELFVDVMKHFIKHTSASKENPALLIIDNHESHLSLEALDIAKSFGITVLIVPPHTTAKLEPLDVGINGPFESFYNAAVDSWLLRNPGQALTIYHVAECVGQAFMKAMAPINITNSFKKCGIYPYDDSVFTEEDFQPSLVTDRPDPSKENIETEVEDGLNKSSSQSILLNITSERIQDFPMTGDALDKPHASTSKKYIRPPMKAGPRKNNKRHRTLGKTKIPEKDKIAERKKKTVKEADLFQERKVSKKVDKNLIQIEYDTSSAEETFNASGSSSGGDQFVSDSEDDEIILDERILSTPLHRDPKLDDFCIILIETEKKKQYCCVGKILEECDESDCDFYVSYLKRLLTL